MAALLGLLGAAAGLAQPLAAREVIESLASDESLSGPILLLTALVAAAAFVTALHYWLLERTAQRVVLRARRGLAGRVLRLRMAELDRLAPGDLVARATSDTTLLGEVASTGLVQSFKQCSRATRRRIAFIGATAGAGDRHALVASRTLRRAARSPDAAPGSAPSARSP